MISLSRFVSLLLALALLFGFALASGADTLNVPADFTTVQEAIEAASDGDEVVVAPGTYNERIDYRGKALTVRSTDPDDPDVVASTILDATGLPVAPTQIDGAGSVVTFGSREGAGSVLTGLTITGSDSAEKGGGIHCGWWTKPIITKNIIQGNSSQRGGHWGGGIFCYNYSEPTITDNIIRENWAFEGGGIYCHNYSNPLIQNNLIEDNWTEGLGTGRGAGIFVCFASPRIFDNIIRNNTVGGPLSAGGGLACFTYGNPRVEGNIFEGNSALIGGAVYVHTFAEPAFKNNLFLNNEAVDQATPTNPEIQTGRGGAVYCFFSEPTFENDTFYGNTATEGGTFWCNGSSPRLTNCIVAGTRSGGAFFASPEEGLDISYSCVWNNAGGDYLEIEDPTGTAGNFRADPLFAAPATGDFHLRSTAGRWDAPSSDWVMDSTTSPCVDAGNPASPYDQEPTPHGDRVNLGAYGNTAEASRSPE